MASHADAHPDGTGSDNQRTGLSSSSNNPIMNNHCNEDRSMPQIKVSNSPARRGSGAGQSGPTGGPGGTRPQGQSMPCSPNTKKSNAQINKVYSF
jgi:hypothetical protein